MALQHDQRIKEDHAVTRWSNSALSKSYSILTNRDDEIRSIRFLMMTLSNAHTQLCGTSVLVWHSVVVRQSYMSNQTNECFLLLKPFSKTTQATSYSKTFAVKKLPEEAAREKGTANSRPQDFIALNNSVLLYFKLLRSCLEVRKRRRQSKSRLPEELHTNIPI